SKQAGARSDGVSLGFGQRGLTMVELLVAMVISLPHKRHHILVINGIESLQTEAHPHNQ
ncbi:MAG: hypothetical protein B7Y76_01175, partial [Sphingobacteriia bacterium 35-40-5]